MVGAAESGGSRHRHQTAREDAQDMTSSRPTRCTCVVGPGNRRPLMWPFFGIIMLVLMLGRSTVCVSTRNDHLDGCWRLCRCSAGGRVIGAFYRFLLQLAPGHIAVYAYSARKTLSVRCRGHDVGFQSSRLVASSPWRG